MKKEYIVGGVIVAAVVAVLGYGLYNASKVRSYAKEIDTMITESDAKWNSKTIEKSSSSATDIQKTMNEVKTDSEVQLAKLNSMSAPGKAKNLEKKTKEYFTLAKNAAEQTSAFLAYVKVIEASSGDVKNVGTGNPGDVVGTFTKMHEGLTSAIQKLEAATPPSSMKDFHDKYIVALKKMDAAIVKATDYAKTGQTSKLQEVTTELDNIAKDLDSIKTPSNDTILEDLATKENKNKLDLYPGQIKREAQRLEKTVISY